MLYSCCDAKRGCRALGRPHVPGEGPRPDSCLRALLGWLACRLAGVHTRLGLNMPGLRFGKLEPYCSTDLALRRSSAALRTRLRQRDGCRPPCCPIRAPCLAASLSLWQTHGAEADPRGCWPQAPAMLVQHPTSMLSTAHCCRPAPHACPTDCPRLHVNGVNGTQVSPWVVLCCDVRRHAAHG